jgi:preprotein translocase subunit YajC
MMHDALAGLVGSALVTLGQVTQPVAGGIPVIAPTTGPATQAAAVPWWAGLLASPFFPLILGLLVLYFFVFRAKSKQEKDKKKLLESVKRGDGIETIGGLLGTVISADEQTVTIKVDESNNVKMKFNRRAIYRVITEDGKETTVSK